MLPRAVREAGERAEKLAEQLRGEQAKPEGDQDPPQDPQPQGDPPAQPQVPQPDPAPQGGDPEDETWRTKYTVLQGKYNSEVPRLAAQLRAANARIEAQDAALAELRQKVETAAKAPPAPDPNEERLVQEYGPEIVQTIERIADRKAAERVAPLQGKVEESEAERRAREQRDAEAKKAADFAEAVEDLVPEWEAIDKLPAFHAYLADLGPDGRPRQAALMEAAQNFDAAGAARIFIAWKRSPAGQAAMGSAPQPKTDDRLVRQQVPGTSGRDRAPGGGKKIWTKAEMKDFFRDVALGKIEPDRAKEIERDIDEAAREGRIRG